MKLSDKQRGAKEFLDREQYEEAIIYYEQCIESEPNQITNYWLLGLILLLSGREVEAQNLWLSVMVQGTPEEIEQWTDELIKLLDDKGQEYLQTGKYQEAEKIYLQVLEIIPNDIETYRKLGNAFLNQDKLESATACYQQTLALDSNYVLGYCNLGAVLLRQSQIEEAIAYLQHSIALNPNHAVAHYNLGSAFDKKGKLDEAITCYQQALSLERNNYLAANNIGTLLQKQGKPLEALSYFKRSLDSNPKYALAYKNIGILLQNEGKISEAIFWFREVIKYNPNCSQSYYDLGFIYWIQGEFERAIDCFSKTIELDPENAEAHWNRGIILLSLGDYKRGFEGYEWRWRRLGINQPASVKKALSLPQPFWLGESLQGKTILLHGEQGFGDTIQFIRYVPLVSQCGGEVVVECHQALHPLIETMPGVKKVVTRNNIDIEFDVHAFLMNLPKILGTTLETIPAQVPYLLPPSDFIGITMFEKIMLKIGVVWATGYYRDNQETIQAYQNKSCPLDKFLFLTEISGIGLYSLQVGEDATVKSHQTNFQDLSNQIHDFGDTAAAIAKLDLVISVDTAVAHLAGALGKPVWLLLPFKPDWRWMLEREDSPWYPTMRLFRQCQPGDWAEVFDRVKAALLHHLNTKDFLANQIR